MGGASSGPRTRPRIAIAVALALTVTTCSSGDTDDSTSSPPDASSIDGVDSTERNNDSDNTDTDNTDTDNTDTDEGSTSNNETSAPASLPVEYIGPGSVSERPHTINVMASDQPVGFIHRESPQSTFGSDWGPDNRLYLSDPHGSTVVALDDDGAVEDLGLWRDGWFDEGLVQDIAFDTQGVLHVRAGERILQVGPSGAVAVLVEGVPPIEGFVFGPDNSIYATDLEAGSVLQWVDQREWRVVTDQVPGARWLDFGPDGSLYVAQPKQGRYSRVDMETGEVETFLYGLDIGHADAQVVPFGDAGTLAFDPYGDVWVLGQRQGGQLYRITMDGTIMPYRVDDHDYGELPWLPTGACGVVEMDPQRRLWVSCYDGRIVRLDPRPGADYDYDSVVVRDGFKGVIAIAPDDTIYATILDRQQLVQFADDAPMEVVADFDEKAWGTTVDIDGTVLVALESRIVAVTPDGEITPVSGVAAERLMVMADGTLYASRKVDDGSEQREVVRIESDGTVTPILTEFEGQRLGTTEVHLDRMHDGRLIAFDELQGNVFVIDADGSSTRVLNLIPIGAFNPGAFAASPTRAEFYVTIEIDFQKYLYRVDLDGNVQLMADGVAQDPHSAVVSADGNWLFLKELGAIGVFEIPDGPVVATEPSVLPTEAPPEPPRPDASGPSDDVSDNDRRALCDAYLDFFAAPPPERSGPLEQIAAHVGEGAPAELEETIEVLATADYGSTDVRPQMKVLGDYVLPLCIDTYEAAVVPAADDTAAAEQFLSAVIEGDRALAGQIASELALVQFEPWDNLGIVQGYPRTFEADAGFYIELTQDRALFCEVSGGVVRTCRRG